MKLTEQQKRVIRENPHIQSGKLAKLIGCNTKTVQRNRKNIWSYEGVGIPFMRFDGLFRVKYKHCFIFASSSMVKSLNVVDHLIWCIESNMFNQPRVEHPYFENLTLGNR